MNHILADAQYVAARSQHVTIDDAKATAFAKTLPVEKPHWSGAAPFTYKHLSDDDEIAFAFVFNSINYSYWGEPKWAIEWQGKTLDGSWGMIGALRRAIEEGRPILDPAYLASIPREEFAHVLRGNTAIPLFEERLACLHELGTVVRETWYGSFSEVVRSAGYDALQLLETITTSFSRFDDSATYDGRRIQFQKRAQLLISDLAAALDGRGLGRFENIDELTAFADYKIPQILRELDILNYDNDLARIVDGKIEIEPGSPREVEIRAGMIVAVDKIKHAAGGMLTASDIDHFLWLAAQKAMQRPYHRMRTIAY